MNRNSAEHLTAAALMMGLVALRRPCEEASVFSKNSYVPCGKESVALVWHNKEGRIYHMCFGCANHNVRDRDAVLLAGKNIISYEKGGK